MYELASERWVQLTDHAEDDFEARFSPDGGHLAFTSTRTGNKDIWLLSLDDGGLERLTDSDEDDEYPAFSPDGRQIVYTGGKWGARSYLMVPAQGGTPHTIGESAGRAGACSFDPGGASVVCHRYDLGSGDLVRLWTEDGIMAPLTLGDAWDYKPNPSPDGRWVAFSRAVDGGGSNLWIMPAEGGRPWQLTRSAGDDRWPTWSGDGRKLFFHRVVEEGQGVFLYDRETGRVRTLLGPEHKPLQASLHPDGSELAYCAQIDGVRQVRVVDLRGEGPSRILVRGAYESCDPRWSPDGKSLALTVRESSASRWEVAVVTLEGERLRVLTGDAPGLRGMDGPIDWAPDGASIVFQADTGPFEADLFRVDVETGALERLLDDAWFDECPSWTADGRGILFMSTRGGDWTWGFFRLDLETGEITSFAGPDYVQKNFPRSSPDGAIAWSQYDGERHQHLVERGADGRARRIREAGTGARWPSYTTDGSAIVFSRVERTVEYWLIDEVGAEPYPVDPATQPGDEARVAESPRPVSNRLAGLDRSPVDLHHR